MDNVTHTLTGLALARAGLARKTRGGTLALVLASNLPDIDLVTAVGGNTAYLAHHRGITHSVVGAPVLALLLALAIWSALRPSHLPTLFLASLTGVFVHVFMDLWTSYGTRILEPFSGSWYTLDLVFIVDPLILLVLLAGVRMRPRGVRASLALILVYVLSRGGLHALALGRLQRETGAIKAAALPHPLNPFVWRGVADTGDAYMVGEIRPLGGPSSLVRREKAPETDVVRLARKSEAASVFLDFSPFPWLEVRDLPGGVEVVWRDLRFQVPGRRSFETEVVVGRDGRILSQAFHF